MALAPDGKVLYVPSLEKDALERRRCADRRRAGEDRDQLRRPQHALFAATAARSTSRACGRRCCRSPMRRHTKSCARSVRSRARSGRSPSTARRRSCYVNINELLGFEIGDLKTGLKLHHVEVQGYQKGPVLRHGCPSHGIGLTPDEREVWLCDGHNSAMHIFDNTVMPPKQIASLKLRDQPGWITFTHRRQTRLSVDRRGLRHENQKARQGAPGRNRARDRQREAARNHRGRHEAGPGRRPVRRRQEAIAPAHGRDSEAGAPASPP